MLIARVENATRVLGAPPGWSAETSDLCGGLPIRDEQTEGGLPCMTSAWTPTPEELAALAAGASVYLTIVGRGHPPVSLTVGPPPE